MAFVAKLSEANSGTGSVEMDWSLEEINDRELVVGKNGLRVRVGWDSVVPRPAATTGKGDRVGLRIPKELLAVSPGYCVVISNAGYSWGHGNTTTRLYWNVRMEDAATVVAEATGRLNEMLVPFRMKILADPARYDGRSDSAILYLDKADYVRFRRLLENLHIAIAPNLDDGTPLFTKKLASGLGCADDPGSGASFGFSRCAVLAEGIVRSYEQGATDRVRKLAVIEGCFAAHHIDLTRPYLNEGSPDEYKFIEGSQTPTGGGHGRSGKSMKSTRTRTPLEVAMEVGAALMSRAHWHADRCNWTALELGESEGRRPTGVAYRALGPAMYSGTSGIALFLAELHVETGDAHARRTSLGAIRQAIGTSDRLTDVTPLGLYAGALGVALSAAYIGTLLEEEELAATAAKAAWATLKKRSMETDCDLVSGIAGGIVALICLANLLSDQRMIGAAFELGHRLMRAGVQQSDYWTWTSSGQDARPALTGLSHGAAGIGLAFLLLYEATRHQQFRELAEGAFRYEARCYVKRSRNWADFRLVDSQSEIDLQTASCTTAWCHGAPGIALSRLQAYSLLGTEAYADQALEALRTTRRWTEAMLNMPRADFSLCHGLAGNAAVLQYGSDMLGDRFAYGGKTAQKVMDAGIERYGFGGRLWPFERINEGSPSLMAGEAGVGHFYLSMHRKSVPAALLWHPNHIWWS
jgi:hypothetical protein